MLSYADLITLEPSLRRSHVLSVYVEGQTDDPAQRDRWRLQLEQALEAERSRLADASREDRERFATCVGMLERELDSAGVPGARGGWVAFITPEGAWYSKSVPMRFATSAVWGRGAWVAPYVQALCEVHTVFVAVMDARAVWVYRYRHGELDRLDELHAHHHVDTPLHMGDTSRVGFHSGTRGVTGHDAAQRAHLEGTRRMLSEAAERIHKLAEEDGWIVLGGIANVVARMTPLLAPLADRVSVADTLDVHSSPAEIAEAARRGAAALRERHELGAVHEIAHSAEAGALSALGEETTRKALEQSCVRELYLSPTFIDHRPEATSRALRRAFDQSAHVEVVTGKAAQQLDELGGIAAQLRYQPCPRPPDRRSPRADLPSAST